MEPVPADVRAAALRAFATRDIGMKIADLADDSVFLDPAPAVRHLRFVTPEWGIGVEVLPLPDALRLCVTVDAPGEMDLQVRHAGAGAVSARSTGGRPCELGPVHRGLVCVLCRRPAGATTTRTSWVAL